MGNMYERSVRQWNPWAGCLHECVYCVPSFQAQMKRQRKNCERCYEFEPHPHPRRLRSSLPATGPGEFVFACASGDVAFAPKGYRQKIAYAMASDRNRKKTFLLQSKDPGRAFSGVMWPPNAILGTTIETEDEAVAGWVSKAPPPERRFRDLRGLLHASKMVTIEPVLKMDPWTLAKWVEEIGPVMAWVGYDSKGCLLPEPSRADVRVLISEIRRAGIEVLEKTIRPAHWEE